MRCGTEVLVDQDIAEQYGHYTWKKDKNGYPIRCTSTYCRDTGKRTSLKLSLHRTVMEAPKGTIVDHKSGDLMDARRANLRFVTHTQNNTNITKPKNRDIPYKGVFRNKRTKKFEVRVGLGGKNVYFGLYETMEEAAKVYNRYAFMFHGEYAALNILP